MRESQYAENRCITIDGRILNYCLERKKVKNINLRIRKDGSIAVSASARVSVITIESFLKCKASFINKAREAFLGLQRNRPAPKEYVSGETYLIKGRGLRLIVSKSINDSVCSDGVYIYLNLRDPSDFQKRQRLITGYLNRQCVEIFTDVLNRLYLPLVKYGIKQPTLRIRRMETRWGTCMTRKGIITLNKRLLETPTVCIEYVVLHELCHLIHPNHSRQFYDFLTMFMPDWKNRKKLLNRSI